MEDAASNLDGSSSDDASSGSSDAAHPDAGGECGDVACPEPCSGDCFKVDVIRRVEQPIGNPTYLTNDGFDLTFDSDGTIHVVYSYQDWWQDPNAGDAWTRRWRIIYAHREGSTWQSEEIPDLGIGSTFLSRGVSWQPHLHRIRIFVDDAGIVRVSLNDQSCCGYTYLLTRATNGTWTNEYDQVTARYSEYRDGTWFIVDSSRYRSGAFGTPTSELIKTSSRLMLAADGTPWIFGALGKYTAPEDFEIYYRRGDDDWVLDHVYPFAQSRTESLLFSSMLAYPDGRVAAVTVIASVDEDKLQLHSRASDGSWSTETVADVTFDDEDTELFPSSDVNVLSATAGPHGETHILFARRDDVLVHKLKRSASGPWETIEYEAMRPHLVVPDAAGHLHLLRRRIAETPATIEYLEHVEITP
jgi:hypothetical protein